MPRVLTTYSGVSSTVERNLEWGLRHGRWGLRQEPKDFAVGRLFEWHLIGARARGLPHGPRAQPQQWVTAEIDIYLLRVRSPLRLESSPLWPDEVEEGATHYPFRFDVELVAEAARVPAAYDEPIPKVLSEGVRRAAARAEGVYSVEERLWANFLERMRASD